MAPFPEVFLININWFSDQTKYMETFYFSISIALEFNMSDMFEVQPKSAANKNGKKLVAGTEVDKMDEKYMLMGLVCFVGAHYLSFIKSELDKKIIWKMFDDDKPIFVYHSWEAVIHNILQYGNLPTLLIYQRKTDGNKHLSEKELT